MFKWFKNLFKKEEDITVLNVRLVPEGGAEIDLQISERYSKVIEIAAAAEGLSNQDFLVKILKDYIEEQKKKS